MGSKRGDGKPASPFSYGVFFRRIMEPDDMLQDIPPGTLREARACVLETERLTLRRPTLADVNAITTLANDRRIAENTRRLPHPYSQDDAVEFVSAQAAQAMRETVFLVERDYQPIGMVGIDWRRPNFPELGYWLGVDNWGQGFATEAVRAVIDFVFEEYDIEHLIAGARVANPASRNVLEKCGFQWSGVELHRFEALGSSTPVDCFRLTRGVWSSLKSWSNSTRRDE
jgi:RimJ/RimL family protein N-acetyltransferase